MAQVENGSSHVVNGTGHECQNGQHGPTDFIENNTARGKAARPISDENAPTHTCDYYSQWSKTYEVDMAESGFSGPYQCAEKFLELELDKDVQIMDILAGTGIIGRQLGKAGYKNIDAIDGSEDMMILARKQNLYRNYFISFLGRGHKAPVLSNHYDVLIMAGTFAPGHLYSDVFEDLIRITKPGGIITWAMRDDYVRTLDTFASFDDDVTALIDAGVWREYKPRQRVMEYLLGKNGYVYTMQKC